MKAPSLTKSAVKTLDRLLAMPDAELQALFKKGDPVQIKFGPKTIRGKYMGSIDMGIAGSRHSIVKLGRYGSMVIESSFVEEVERKNK